MSGDHALLVVGLVAGFLIGFGARQILSALHLGEKVTLTSWWHEDGDYVLKFSDGSAYKGDCTVWYNYESAVRCPTGTERWLGNWWQAIKWGRHNDKQVHHLDETLDVAPPRVLMDTPVHQPCQCRASSCGHRKIPCGTKPAFDFMLAGWVDSVILCAACKPVQAPGAKSSPKS